MDIAAQLVPEERCTGGMWFLQSVEDAGSLHGVVEGISLEGIINTFLSHSGILSACFCFLSQVSFTNSFFIVYGR